MADKKISQLNTATTVFDADDFTIVQDGETKQANASTVKAYAKDGLSKSDVGLGNVDNTSDLNKPVSTATQTALNLKQDASSAATLTGTQTLTNKTISGSTNTLSDIGNSSLTNSSITFGSTSHALGSTVSALNGVSLGQGVGGAAAGNFTTLGATGNVTLGDQNTDTLTINGTAVSAPNGLNVNSNQLVLSGGNLGLGGAPTYKLDATGTIRANVASNSYAFLVDNGTYSGGLIPSTATGGLILYNAVAQPLGFWTNNVERMRIDASGSLGIGVFPNSAYTACLQLSSGITFPATQVASTNANTLDDYEEGTWTPSVGGNATYSLQDAYYVKIGKVVYVTGRLLINVLGTGSASTVSGLPFVSANTYARGILSLGTAATVASTAFYSLECEVANNTSTFIFIGRTAAGNASAQATVLTNGANIQFSGFYFTP